MELHDRGDVHLSGLAAGDEAHVRLPASTRPRTARVLGAIERHDGLVEVHLDRLVHPPGCRQVGEYAVRGGYTTILTGPRPRSA